jgi:hypothetical protein
MDIEKLIKQDIPVDSNHDHHDEELALPPCPRH